jgi:glucose-6-phosphate 1-epimerase
MTIQELNDQFALPGVLAFEEHQGLIRAQVTSSTASATIYLHGAHITHWQPSGHEARLYLSPRTALEPGKAIRGGIPICFPWFGPRSDGGAGPMHGFARIQDWSLAFAALVPSPGQGDQVHLTFTLEPNELSRSLGFDHFRAAYQVVVGKSLALKLIVANTGAKPLVIEEALHTYFAVPSIESVSITGLEGAEYIDKTDNFARKRLPDAPLRFTAATDSMFPGHTANCTISTPGRTLVNAKSGSSTTVVWNPGSKATLADLPPDGWQHFVCVEAANAGADAIAIAPGATHTLEAVITAVC